ncbi:Threonine/homoserine efflux transporter RhtA [Modicisalibacter muralis]|uniref:Threonine/homoserine efflux transporter RhtA n=1 Tax=Modicisalibacter muralis TaxID=119000 RepID=A0A1G9F4C2_9GAMM|nr:DMT family transporter [Halomonas muralis]SDK83083.1 Threonine/homoserine efflux transporter RhtA [Halomonas muralis]
MLALRPYLLLLLTVIIFSGNILIGKALAELPALTISWVRVFIAMLVMVPIGASQMWRAMPVFKAHLPSLLGLALTGVAFFNALIYAALKTTSSTNVAILESTIPVVTILFGFALFGERYRAIQWLGVAASLTGAVAVVTQGDANPVDGVAIGDAIMLIAVLTWVGYSLLVKEHMAKFPRYGGLLAMLIIANLALAPLAMLEWLWSGRVPDIGTEQALGLAYLGIFPSVIALLFYNSAIGDIGPTQASVFLNLLPVFTMLGAWLLIGETITLVQVVGSLVVVGGVLLTTRGRRGG